MRRHPVPRQFVLALGALAGVALAHVLDYLLVVPGGRRAALLAETGHVWNHVAALGASAGVLAVAGALFCGVRRATMPDNGWADRPQLFDDVRWVALLQVALFGGMEIVERVLSHAPMTDLLRGRLFVVGLALQVVVAWVVVAMLRTTEIVGEYLLRALCRPLPARGCSRVRGSQRSLASLVAARHHGCRGPPSRRFA